MKEIEKQIKEIAARLFGSGQVDIFMAWEKGDFDFQSKPLIARNTSDVNRIIFNEYCIHNLANSLLKFRDSEDRIGIVVKGCDSRGIVRLLEDNQFDRERLYIVGVNCPGMKDPLEAMRNSSGLSNATKEAGRAAKCLRCNYPNPVIYDEILGIEQQSHAEGDRFAAVSAVENKSLEERYNFFEETFSRCIRCYACRQACVACNCRVCIFDEMKPQWVGRETNQTDNMMYHLVRALHMAGRCIECGECERVCPVNIPLMLINQKLAQDVNKFFGPYEAGIKYVAGAKPPLSVYKQDDPDDFL
ncbi:MAG: 4Fe-4S binding protein [Syntrophomonadaceae bacterium]|jgi:formate dehydrogenase subunit beta